MDMPEKTDAFRANIRQQCILQGLTQDELARRAKLSPEWLCRMLRGKSNPTLPVCERIAKALETSLEALVAIPAPIAPAEKIQDSTGIPIDAA